MSEEATRILALEARLDDVQATLMAHDLLVRALLAHLAVAEPEAWRQIGERLTKLKAFREGGGGGELPREVAEEIALTLADITRTVATRRGG